VGPVTTMFDLSPPWRVIIGTLAIALLGGCPGLRHKSDANAPGIVHLEAPPPRENGTDELYVEPEDPGEHEVYIGPAIILGPASGRTYDADQTEFETSIQVRLAYQALEKSHKSRDIAFTRGGGWALVAGWTPLQTEHAPGGGIEANLGPVYAEVERYWWYLSAGLGVAAYTQDFDVGPQLTLNAAFYGMRLRYMADGDFEIMAAFRIELPTVINWSR
jgi:hypothetical protein